MVLFVIRGHGESEQMKNYICCIMTMTLLLVLRGAMGEISNFYNFLSRMLIFGTHMPPVVTKHVAKFH